MGPSRRSVLSHHADHCRAVGDVESERDRHAARALDEVDGLFDLSWGPRYHCHAGAFGTEVACDRAAYTSAGAGDHRYLVRERGDCDRASISGSTQHSSTLLVDTEP